MDFEILDRRPVVVAVAGPNGAGKSTFYSSHLGSAGLPFINADLLAREFDLDAYAAARMADELRRAFVARGESFAFETVFSDPVGDKLAFLKLAAEAGYAVALFFIGIAGPEVSEQRIAMRVVQGGHDVPSAKLWSRFPRTLDNLKTAIRELPYVLVFDNDDISTPFRLIARFETGRLVESNEPIPEWLRRCLGSEEHRSNH
jgi:predicted ABC-type ATPase